MSSLKPYIAYKDSGLRWLGDVPSHWTAAPLWSLFRRNKVLGTGSEELLSVYRDYGVVPKSSRNDNFNKASEDLSKYQIVEQGDLVINKMKAWQGSVAISDFEGIVSPAYYIFKPLATMHPRFMHHLMRSIPYFQHYASISSGVRPNQWDLDPTMHRVMPVLLPPLDEQRAIAIYLDHETSRIDAFIADQEDLINLLEERRAATISHTVTKGLNLKTAFKDSGTELLGRIPEDWEITRMKAAVRKKKNLVGDSWDRYLLLSLTMSGVIPRDLENIVGKMPSDFTTYQAVEKDDLIFCLFDVEETPRTVGWSPQQGMVTGAYTATEVRKGFVPKFVAYYYLAFDQYKSLRKYYAGLRNTIRYADFGNIPLVRPPEVAQQEIVDYLDQELSEIDAAIADARESISLSRERRAALISAAVTGKIDVRDWTGSKERTLEAHGVA